MNDKTYVHVRLMQEDGVIGPEASLEISEDTKVNEIQALAREWACGQTGWPWDVVTWETDDGMSGSVDLGGYK